MNVLVCLAWVCALLPLATTHGSYLLAAVHEQVPWCIPYWDSCTSISATGRELPAKYLFKLGMMTTALMTAMLWWCLWRWGRVLAESRSGTASSKPESIANGMAMPIIGTAAAISLLLYTLALGEVGEGYRFLRRTGVVLAFALTFIAQVLFLRLVGALSAVPELGCLRRYYRAMLWLLVSLLLVGITSVILDAALGDRYDQMEDAFEWWMALMLNGFFIHVARVLKKRKVNLAFIPANL